MRLFGVNDDRSNKGEGISAGVYSVQKHSVVESFNFGLAGDPYDTAQDAYEAMQAFLRSRYDTNKLRVFLIDRVAG